MKCGCVICQDSFDAAVGIVTTKCGHVFHNQCIDKWLERSGTCPECRSKVCKKSVTKLFFNFSLDNNSLDNNSLDALKEQLRAKDLECMEKDKNIKELQFYCAKAESNVEKLHQQLLECQNEFSKLNRVVQKLNVIEAKCQALIREKNTLESELEHLNNVKMVVEGCCSDADKILENVQVHEGKEACNKIAAFCSVLKREFTRSKEEKHQLQIELTQVKRQMGIAQADNAKKLRMMKEKETQLKKQVKYMQDLSSTSASCDASPIPSTPSVPSSSSQLSHLAKSASTSASHNGSSNCDKQVTPITVDLPDTKRPKLNVVVLDKEVPKVSAHAPETPVLRLANSTMPGRPNIRYQKDDDSVSRIGYNGLGWHGRFVTGSGMKKGKPFRK